MGIGSLLTGTTSRIGQLIRDNAGKIAIGSLLLAGLGASAYSDTRDINRLLQHARAEASSAQNTTTSRPKLDYRVPDTQHDTVVDKYGYRLPVQRPPPTFLQKLRRPFITEGAGVPDWSNVPENS